MNTSQIAKSTQEQAVASWVDHLNQLRIDRLVASLTAQDENLQGALEALSKLKTSVFEEVVTKNRGGDKGMHGFIAERMQVGIENARKLVVGANTDYLLIDDNGVVDYIRGDDEIQQKFRQLNLGFDAIKEHCKTYPEFTKSGGIYQIPKDYYEKFKELIDLSPEQAGKLPNKDYSLWKNIHKVLDETGIDPAKIEPTAIDYSDTQRNTYENTIDKEEVSIKDKDQERRKEAYQQSKPSLQEGLKITAISAGIEGGMSFCLGVHKKIKSGKRISEFTAKDWQDVGIDTAVGGGKGAIRGASIYGLTNFTATPAAVASALVTATFGVVSQARLLQQGKISTEDFIINSEVVCLDVTVSAISSLIGQVMIPVPILGAIIGNTAGMFMYGIAKNNLSQKEQAIIDSFNSDMKQINEHLDAEYIALIEQLFKEFAKFKSVLDLAFDIDVNVAFAGSISLAQYVGCANSKILWNKRAVDDYFLN
ncbi:MAG: hypothetical protein FWB75_03080 [Oscillospiraceae bacterium]|nr:hypothetical protein [Oscillospiraceae bacterium]